MEFKGHCAIRNKLLSTKKIKSAGQLEIGQFTNSFTIADESVMVNNQLGLVTFNVKREGGDGDIVEINVILKGSDGTSKNFL